MSALFFERNSANVGNNEVIQKARAALSTGDLKGAESLLISVLDQDPSDFEGRYTMAVLHRTRGEHALAKNSLSKLMSEKPE